ncbi:Rossmann-fold NAD(P)-binding domain-containing protein [Mucilaginibacter paludis]|uniref:NAD-dependent epimerase/dehydratase n=1 Tax=Mucilaginibacter paludis DSM 18603 TaxID=714943 RepID=H1XZT5_9SPHI|nr:NAD-dependent epimerase/dehydratase [Mucilaginibacter paludis]EHQ27777.1 NAD-dependent epimerase/dehydratase [Mucilaginibacter paludis DSM 18603]
MDKNISILGCGWLGFPLAIQLVASGWRVKGSTTTIDKINLLSANEIDPYLVHLQEIKDSDTNLFLNSETLLFNVPPSLKKRSETEYLEQVANLVNFARSSPIKKVIFISSTSVYPELNKPIIDTDDVDENTVVFKSEKLFTQCSSFKTTVIRFAGLIGPGRHPSRFFAGKKNIPNGKAPVNLIHLDDCIAVIKTVLNAELTAPIYHAAAPSHPTRAAFYTAAAQQAGLPLPEFIDELAGWKMIDSVQLEKDLGYRFIYPDLIDSLNHWK